MRAVSRYDLERLIRSCVHRKDPAANARDARGPSSCKMYELTPYRNEGCRRGEYEGLRLGGHVGSERCPSARVVRRRG